jgi:putative transposase
LFCHKNILLLYKNKIKILILFIKKILFLINKIILNLMLSKEQILERNKLIGENGLKTRMKRAKQICKTFRFKIDYNNLNKQQKEHIKMLFIEAKWIYNYLISQDDIYSFNYKDLNQVTHKDKNRNDIVSDIQYVRSSVKQELITQIINQIKGLSKLKKKGHKVGKLRFKSEFNSIKLKQYNVTHSLRGNKFKIQGIKDLIRVRGIEQLAKYKNIDYTTANLLYDGINYYIALTCFIDKDNAEKQYKNDIVGIDMGVSTSLTLSDGIKYDISIEESDRLKKLQAKLVSKQKGSNNRYKLIKKIRKEYIHISNKKNDISNKIVHSILNDNKIIVIQDEQISEWRQDGLSGSKIQHSILGRIKSKLINNDRTIILDKWFPTTKYCRHCGSKVELELKDRIFECPKCKIKEDRDIHAANNMIYFYLHSINAPGTDVNMLVDNKISYKKFVAKQESTTSLA